MSDEIDMEYTIGDAPPLRADEIYAAYDRHRAEFVRPDGVPAPYARLAELEKQVRALQESLEHETARAQRLMVERNKAQRFTNENADLISYWLDMFKRANAAKRQAKRERDARGLTLATLCDMVLGEDATDRSDTALIRAVGTLTRERDATLLEFKQASENYGKLFAKKLNELDAVNAAKEQAEADARALALAYSRFKQMPSPRTASQLNIAYQEHGAKYLEPTP